MNDVAGSVGINESIVGVKAVDERKMEMHGVPKLHSKVWGPFFKTGNQEQRPEASLRFQAWLA